MIQLYIFVLTLLDEETPLPVNGECYPRAMCPSPPPPILEPYENNHFNDETDDEEIVANVINNHVAVIPEGNAVRQHLLTITTNVNRDTDELSKQELLDIKQHNAKVRKLLFIEVKRPGQSKYISYFNGASFAFRKIVSKSKCLIKNLSMYLY